MEKMTIDELKDEIFDQVCAEFNEDSLSEDQPSKDWSYWLTESEIFTPEHFGPEGTGAMANRANMLMVGNLG